MMWVKHFKEETRRFGNYTINLSKTLDHPRYKTSAVIEFVCDEEEPKDSRPNGSSQVILFLSDLITANCNVVKTDSTYGASSWYHDYGSFEFVMRGAEMGRYSEIIEQVVKDWLEQYKWYRVRVALYPTRNQVMVSLYRNRHLTSD